MPLDPFLGSPPLHVAYTKQALFAAKLSSMLLMVISRHQDCWYMKSKKQKLNIITYISQLAAMHGRGGIPEHSLRLWGLPHSAHSVLSPLSRRVATVSNM